MSIEGGRTLYEQNKKPHPLDTQGLAASIKDDSDWVRTSDLYPVKVALSQLSYGIVYIRQVLFYYVYFQKSMES